MESIISKIEPPQPPRSAHCFGHPPAHRHWIPLVTSPCRSLVSHKATNNAPGWCPLTWHSQNHPTRGVGTTFLPPKSLATDRYNTFSLDGHEKSSVGDVRALTKTFCCVTQQNKGYTPCCNWILFCNILSHNYYFVIMSLWVISVKFETI